MSEIREYVGGAVPSTLESGINDSATSLTLTSVAGWPTGTVGPFTIVINPGASEEKIKITSRSGNTLTVATRGFDGTTAQAHDPDSVVKHVLVADDITLLNQHAGNVNLDDHTQYVHKDIARTITADHTHTGDETYEGTTTFNGPVEFADAPVPATHAASHAPGGDDSLEGDYVPAAQFWDKGVLLAGTGEGTYDGIGTDGARSILQVDSSVPAGIAWKPLTVNEDFFALNKALRPDGVDLSVGSMLPAAYGANSVLVGAYRAFASGLMFSETLESVASVDNADRPVSGTKLGLVVLRVEGTYRGTHAGIYVKVGTPTTYPSLTQGNVLEGADYEIPLAGITVPVSGAVTNIVDKRQIAVGLENSSGDRVKLGDTTLGSDAASIAFTGIPQTFRDLEIVWSARSAAGGVVSLNAVLNGDTGANYDNQSMNATATAITAGRGLNEASAFLGTIPTTAVADLTYWGCGTSRIADYTALRRKMIRTASAHDTGDNPVITDGVATYTSTTAVSSLSLKVVTGANLLAGSRAVLYGVR